MKWHKVEDYPIGSNKYVLVSQIVAGRREEEFCFVAMLKNKYWREDIDIVALVQPTDRWCYINLPEN